MAMTKEQSLDASWGEDIACWRSREERGGRRHTRRRRWSPELERGRGHVIFGKRDDT